MFLIGGAKVTNTDSPPPSNSLWIPKISIRKCWIICLWPFNLDQFLALNTATARRDLVGAKGKCRYYSSAQFKASFPTCPVLNREVNYRYYPSTLPLVGSAQGGEGVTVFILFISKKLNIRQLYTVHHVQYCRQTFPDLNIFCKYPWKANIWKYGSSTENVLGLAWSGLLWYLRTSKLDYPAAKVS
jgi:hypothetical protein